MRKVVAGLFISLDGVTDNPGVWQGDVFDDVMIDDLNKLFNNQDTILMGRKTYQDWENYWPTSTDEPFASFINNTPKYVASTTLKAVKWQNSTLIEGDLAAFIKQLKQQRGGNIGTAGSPSLVRWLLEHDLVDELHLVIHPVIVGKGNSLFDDMALKRLKVVDSQTTTTGVLLVTYQPLVNK